MEQNQNNTADREIRISRLLDAPVELVWEVWTNPEHIAQWWGPNGFTNTIAEMNVTPGGEWNLVMHGPDNRDYKNKSVFIEVVEHEKIVYEHISGHKFVATIEFKRQGNKTHLEWHMLFESKEEFTHIVKTFSADIGLSQNVDKLNSYLETQLALRNLA